MKTLKSFSPAAMFAAAFLVLAFACAAESVKRSVDLDGDGKIDHGELKRVIQLILHEKEGREFKLSDEERSKLAELHDRLDRDKDGQADPSQVRVMLKRLREHHPKIYAKLAGHYKDLHVPKEADPSDKNDFKLK